MYKKRANESSELDFRTANCSSFLTYFARSLQTRFTLLLIISVSISGADSTMKNPAFFITLTFGSILIGEVAVTNDDPTNGLLTLDMIARAGYPAESHTITTPDGYILTLQRIPGKDGSVPVFLQHGFLGTSSDFVVTGKGQALAFLLADNGYDVWLGNARGNTYPRAHTTLSTSDSKFWDFSWDEVGTFDLSTAITYVTNYTSDTLIYIGHSMGTTEFYVMASKKPEIAKKVRAMMSLAPVAYMNHVTTPLGLFAPFYRIIEFTANLLGWNEFFPQRVIRFLSHYACSLALFEEILCANIVFTIFGFDNRQFNYTLMPAILSFSPSRTSIKTLIHYYQEIMSSHFRAYDYGPKKNREFYNSSIPPDYDISKICVPIALFTGDNDWFSATKDVDKLWNQLPNKIERYRVDYPQFTHLDFIYGTDAPKLLYKKLFSVMEKYRDGKASAMSHKSKRSTNFLQRLKKTNILKE